ASVLALQENIIVNCTGLGGLTLWNDRDVHPIKGHLALLNAQSKLDYLFSRNNYLFPRTDAVIIGGTYRYDDATTNPDLALAQQLVDYMKEYSEWGQKYQCPNSTSTIRTTANILLPGRSRPHRDAAPQRF